jgi:hypothetical protein
MPAKKSVAARCSQCKMPCWKEQDLKDSARLPCTNSVLGHDEELPLRDLGNSNTRTKVGARIVDTCADFRVSNVVQIFIMSMVPRLTVARTKIINTPMHYVLGIKQDNVSQMGLGLLFQMWFRFTQLFYLLIPSQCDFFYFFLILSSFCWLLCLASKKYNMTCDTIPPWLRFGLFCGHFVGYQLFASRVSSASLRRSQFPGCPPKMPASSQMNEVGLLLGRLVRCD